MTLLRAPVPALLDDEDIRQSLRLEVQPKGSVDTLGKYQDPQRM